MAALGLNGACEYSADQTKGGHGGPPLQLRPIQSLMDSKIEAFAETIWNYHLMKHDDREGRCDPRAVQS